MKLIQSYLHGESLGIPATVGVLIEVEADIENKEKRELLDDLGRELALQIAATNPSHIGERLIQEANQDDDEDGNQEPDDLLVQGWVKDPDKLVGELIYECESKIGKPIKINRFVRYAVSDT